MLRFRTSQCKAIPIVLALLCSASFSQSQNSSNEFSNKVRTVPAPVEPAPFHTAGLGKNPEYNIEFRNLDQLPSGDRILIANAESTIRDLARSARLEYTDNQWSYREISCPTFANHVFLQFRRDNGRGDLSVFSASIPRNGLGRIRLIPILKRSYSLFSPAPINALTISSFNHIRSEEGESANGDWLGNALCYAALAGSQPQIPAGDVWPSLHDPVPQLTATLDVQLDERNEEVITFDDTSAPAHPMEWTMTFSRTGKLVKATHRPVNMLRAQPVPKSSPFTTTRQVP